MTEKKELVEKARRLGREYLLKYGGCAPGTLMAVAHTLNLEVADEVFKAMTGFSRLAGVCGNVCGGIAAMGLTYGVGLEDFVKNPETGSRQEESQEISENLRPEMRSEMPPPAPGHPSGRVSPTS